MRTAPPAVLERELTRRLMDTTPTLTPTHTCRRASRLPRARPAPRVCLLRAHARLMERVVCRAGRAQAKQRWSTLALARRMKPPSLQGWRLLAEASGVEAEAEPEAAEAVAEAAEAAEAEATRCNLEEESEMAALYGDVPNQLRVLGWTPAAEAGFEVVVLLHGWAAAVHDGVQVRAVSARDGGHMPRTCHVHATCHTHAHTHAMSMSM